MDIIRQPIRPAVFGASSGAGIAGRPRFIRGGSYLDSVLSSVCCDVDATIPASYNGSGSTISNLASSPADGAAQSDYDFVDSTFSFGGSGVDSYWETDGTQTADIRSLIDCITLDNARRTDINSPFWFALAGKTTNPLSSLNQYWYGSALRSNPWPAVGLHMVTAGTAKFKTSDDGAHNVGTTGGISVSSDFLVIYSTEVINPTHTHHGWVNERARVTRTNNINIQTAKTTDGAPDAIFSLGSASYAAGSHDYFIPAGSRIYHFSCGNEILDDTAAGLLIDHLEARHARTYT